MSETNILTKFDHYLTPDGPAALVIREHLAPVEGADAVFFPATYAPRKKGDEAGYNIDGPNRTENPSAQNIVLVDSVGSQANRIEPLFAEDDYAGLVPQIVITASEEKSMNLLDVGHRAGDAIARCSELKDTLQAAFKSVLKGDAAPLAKIAPTSLVFGVWDSRDTQAKLPRLLASTIRAYNVRKLTRSAQYTPATDYAALEIFSEEEKQKAEGDSSNPLAARGFVHVPSSGTHGGVIADGGIRRDATLALSALKLLKADTPEITLKLRRYILGLALVAFTRLPLGYYRQGTILVGATDDNGNPLPRTFDEVSLNGTRADATAKITPQVALDYAKAAAAAFGVGEKQTVRFDKEKAVSDVKDSDKNKTAKATKGKKAAETTTPSAP
ncbi:MAG: type I-U CRISPR-associated protein Cas7 [Opitutaceae bacterium]|jgi:CRISPR-associated protein Csb1|nr:type I-U CRISPR-associated protein Cas7 [Opitutaceae bacterium]